MTTVVSARIRRMPLINVPGARLLCALTSPAGWHGEIVAASGDVVRLASGDTVRVVTPRVVEWSAEHNAAGPIGSVLELVEWAALGVPAMEAA